MSKKTKIWLLIAVSLVVVGGLIIGGAMTVLKWDFSLLSTAKLETNQFEITEAFQGISVLTNTADVEFVPSRDGKTTVVCKEWEKLKHSVRVEDGTLIIESVDTRKWYDHIGIHVGAAKVVVSMPAGEYGALSVKLSTGDVNISGDFGFERVRVGTSTGNIRVEKVTAGALEFTVSTGKTEMQGVRCKNLVSKGNTGSLTMTDVIAEEAFSIERSTGNVRFDGCDAAEIYVKTGTGDVTGTLLTEKVFFAQTDTGKVDVPKTASGGKCEIETNTGDIKLKVGK